MNDDHEIVNSCVFLGIDQRPQHHQFCCYSFVPYSLDVKSAVFSLSFQAVVLLTKTATNHRFFSIKSEMSGWI